MGASQHELSCRTCKSIMLWTQHLQRKYGNMWKSLSLAWPWWFLEIRNILSENLLAVLKTATSSMVHVRFLKNMSTCLELSGTFSNWRTASRKEPHKIDYMTVSSMPPSDLYHGCLYFGRKHNVLYYWSNGILLSSLSRDGAYCACIPANLWNHRGWQLEWRCGGFWV